MNKQEFLKILRDTLQSQLSSRETENHVEYYRTYIEEQMREGKTEIEILDVLGDPRLIARTILETSSAGNAYQKQEYTYQEDQKKRQEEIVVPANSLSGTDIPCVSLPECLLLSWCLFW